jgi:beta-galactosidase
MEPDEPTLYVMDAVWVSEEGDRHSFNRRFGFRWFEVKDRDGDKMFFLNGKRIVLRSAISWGHWPVNGIYPTEELARKQILTAKALGLNMLNFHRGIGQEIVLDLADELGLLYYEEPGGYKPNQTELLQRWKREKLLRMVRRDRSHPSLVIYNMINESNREPFDNEIDDMKAAHAEDETRIITFTSTFFGKVFHDGSCPLTPAEFKSHMLPYQDSILKFGWWDEHHAGGPGVYRDSFYQGPDSIFRHYPITEEIVALGEEGAIGTLPRLHLIKSEIESAESKGWDSDDYLKQYDVISRYLKDYGFTSAFPDVDALTQSIGAVSHYYQGRIIENFRIGNTGDFYVVNGWEDTKLENHSGIVDVYRNPKADPSIMAWYNQPLYLAVKIRDKVIPSTGETIADIFIVNENDVKGNFILDISLSDNEGVISSQSHDVKVTGGVRYGELLTSGIIVKGRNDGYLTVNARLREKESVIAEGHDELYFVNVGVDPEMDVVAVADTSGIIQEMLRSTGIAFTSYGRAKPVSQRVMIVGRDIQPGFIKGSFRQDDPVIDWVSEGNTLVIVSGADKWSEYLEDKEVLEYRGRRNIDINWFGGNYFVREHPLFGGLPVNTAFNWEYQSLASYSRERFGLRIPDIENVAGVYTDHMQEVYTAVAVVPVGRGRIIISTLDLEGAIASGERSSAVARRLLINYLEFGSEPAD